MVDAPASGAGVLMDVEVQVLSWAPIPRKHYTPHRPARGDSDNTLIQKVVVVFLREIFTCSEICSFIE